MKCESVAALAPSTKEVVKAFWEEAACGERLLLAGESREAYLEQSRRRYELEPYIEAFAGFGASGGKKVLEIGVGLGADHQRFAEAGAELTGIDLTARAVEHVRRRMELFGLKSDLTVGDAEKLSYTDRQFDVVYAWGVIHHTPRTDLAVKEIWRILKPGGEARVMIYHKYSLVGLMLWVRYGLLRLRPWRPLAEIYAGHLESPGTKAYSRAEARELFKDFRAVDLRVELTHGDLLSSGAGQRHRGVLLTLARVLWPRWLLKRLCRGWGLFMLVKAVK